MFKRLSTKLTVLYAGLFGIALFAVALIVYLAVSDNAARMVRSELQANGAVFDRVWALREQQLSDSADILSRDFGFRDAVATMDAPTVDSALDNLRKRLQIDRAFMMSVDGRLIGLDGAGEAESDLLWDALDADERAAGVLMLDGRPFQAVAAPIRAPNLIGWVVFAAELSPAHLRSLEELAPIPLKASVFTRMSDEAWRTSDTALAAADARSIARLLDSDHANEGAPQRVHVEDGPAIALVKPLHTFGGQGNATLLLRYPLALALAEFQPLLASIIIIGFLSIALIIAGSWALARGLTRPIAALDAAVRALQRGDRTEVSVETSDEIGRLAASFNVMSDEIATREQRITHMALHDSDTGLANRRALDAAILETRDGFALALTIVRFRQIREAIGFTLAVQLVRALGEKAQAAHPTLTLGRLAADTLAIVLATTDEAEALALASDIRATLSGPIAVGGVQVDIVLNAGIAHLQHVGDHVALDYALIAAEQARTSQRDVALFDPIAYGDPARNLSLMSEMIDGINQGQLTLHYQPKFDLRTNEITGAEALVRWNHPTRGRIAPDVFVVMAEETGHIAQLTEWTLIQAISDQQKLRAAGADMLVSVNLSGRLIGDAAFTDLAINLIEDTAADLCLEITETAAMNEPEAALVNIDRYVAAGVRISIDDYGAGLSSLSYLKRIHAHELKLDKSFIQALGEQSREALLVKSTVDLAHSLGMKITAEGVETAPVLALLAAMGCDIAQGYLIGRPMPLNELIATLPVDREAKRDRSNDAERLIAR
ncbi:MAG: EAL domain-containing protein [Alphaproteobacteria bacterium]|nr:EAL domain-containing protein [Alphaproteobacteria bacterium]